MRTSILLVSLVSAMAQGVRVTGPDPIRLQVNPAVSHWCHMVRFRQGWSLDVPMDVIDYEFRRSAASSTEYVVAGWVHEGGSSARYYTTNKYVVDLASTGQPPRPASEQQWREAKEVPLFRHSTFKGNELHQMDPILHAVVELNGHRFRKTGEKWARYEYRADRLSPDGRLLVLNSYSGNGDTGFDFVVKLAHGKLFWDICNTTSGEKLVTIEGGFRGATDPGTLLGDGAWLTDRYYIIPMGGAWERCLVCDFGEAGKETDK